MPSTSLAQHHFFQAVAHNPAFAKQVGVAQNVGRDFEAADKRTGAFAYGGPVHSAIQIAHRMARGKLAAGGVYDPPHPPFGEIGDYRSILSPTAGGVIASEIPGRTDHIPTSVAADTYVIPADIVSGFGEGNTLAGARVIQDWLSTGPHGIPLQRGSARSTIPRPPAPVQGGGRSTTTFAPTLKRGGVALGMPRMPRAPLKAANVQGAREGEVPVILAGGEMLIDPHQVAYHPGLGNLGINDHDPRHYRMAIDYGHRVLDTWVPMARKEIAETLKKLPGPKKN